MTNAVRFREAILFLGASLLCGCLGVVHAQTGVEASDEPVVTQHTVKLPGGVLEYSARAGYLSLRDEQNQVHGRMFYVSYVAKPTDAAGHRPLVFIWNGGPGSNAGLLELGAMGPRRLPDHTAGTPSSGPLVDNVDTWLRFADLVFVDPIFTGYSYALTPEYQHEFLSDEGDADSVAEFIRLYRAHFQSGEQPVYLAGESYGTYRAVGVADVLAKRHIPLAGVMLFSTVLSFQRSADLSQAFLLPNYAAAAFAQHRTGDKNANLDALVNDAEHWAQGPYLNALVQGDTISAVEKHAAAEKLTSYTGVAADVWEKSNLRLSPDQFAVDVLDPNGKRFVGHYDTRAIGTMSRPNAPYEVDRDPSLDNGLDAHIVPYLRNELNWNTDMLYAGPFGGRWPSPESFRADWTSVRWNRGSGSPDRAPVLAGLLRSQPELRIWIGSGVYDFSTPLADVDYMISHLFLPEGARARVHTARYAGGHAMYMDPAVRSQLARDAAMFLHGSTP